MFQCFESFHWDLGFERSHPKAPAVFASANLGKLISSPLKSGNEMTTSVVLETRNEVVSAASETRNEAVSGALKCSPILFCLPIALASDYYLGTIDETWQESATAVSLLGSVAQVPGWRFDAALLLHLM
jgi:hypothetical protein